MWPQNLLSFTTETTQNAKGQSKNPYHQWDQWLHLKSELCRYTEIPIELVHRSSLSPTPNQISSNPLISTSSLIFSTQLSVNPITEASSKQKKNQVNSLEAIFHHLNKSNLPKKKTPHDSIHSINMQNTPPRSKTIK